MIPKFKRRRTKVAIHWPKRRKSGIDDETRAAGMGAFNFDVTLARGHGWSEKQIDRFYEAATRLYIREARRAQKAHPERFETEHDTVMFVGEIDLNGNWYPPQAFRPRKGKNGWKVGRPHG